jgi:hypothetical protein
MDIILMGDLLVILQAEVAKEVEGPAEGDTPETEVKA